MMNWDLSHLALAGATFGVLAVMGLALIAAWRGPTVFDRVLGVNVIGTKTVLLIAVYGFLTDRPEFLDISIAYALINFIGVVLVLKFVESQRKDDDAAATATDPSGPPVDDR